MTPIAPLHMMCSKKGVFDMRNASLLAVFALLGLLASPALAQPHPEYSYSNYKYSNLSGYDPFQLNWSTGRFDYVPMPYEAGPRGQPYQFNWFGGRWDYVPWQPPQSPAEIVAQGKARPVHQVPNYQLSLSRQIRASAQPAAAVIGSTEMRRGMTINIYRGHINKIPPTTARSKSMATTQPWQGQMTLPKDPLNIPATVGHWEYDTTTGHWVHILPPDNAMQSDLGR